MLRLLSPPRAGMFFSVLCLVAEGHAWAQCQTDADCKAPRACSRGLCMEPGTRKGPTPPRPDVPMGPATVAPLGDPAPPPYVPSSPLPPVSPPRPPSDGFVPLAVGITLLSFGALNFITSPICKSGAVGRDMQDACLIASLAVGVACTAVGIPLTIAGASRRRHYNAWKRGVAVSEGFQLLLSNQGVGLSWRY